MLTERSTEILEGWAAGSSKKKGFDSTHRVRHKWQVGIEIQSILRWPEVSSAPLAPLRSKLVTIEFPAVGWTSINYGGFLKWAYPQSSSILDWDSGFSIFMNNPLRLNRAKWLWSLFRGSPIYGNPMKPPYTDMRHPCWHVGTSSPRTSQVPCNRSWNFCQEIHITKAMLMFSHRWGVGTIMLTTINGHISIYNVLLSMLSFQRSRSSRRCSRPPTVGDFDRQGRYSPTRHRFFERIYYHWDSCRHCCLLGFDCRAPQNSHCLLQCFLFFGIPIPK